MKRITIEIYEDTANWIQAMGHEGNNFEEEIAMMVEHICGCEQYWEEYEEWRKSYYT